LFARQPRIFGLLEETKKTSHNFVLQFFRVIKYHLHLTRTAMFTSTFPMIEMMEEGSITSLPSFKPQARAHSKKSFSLASFASSTDLTETLSSGSDSTADNSNESFENLISERVQETVIEKTILPRIVTGFLPRQSESTRWLKYLIGLVGFNIVSMLIGTEIAAQVMLKLGAIAYVDTYAARAFTDPLLITINVLAVLITLGRTIILDGTAFMMLLHGKRRRILPADRRLVHAVIVTQYKEPLEVLDATIESLAQSTLAHSTVVVLACEDRDGNADSVFQVLEGKYGHYFRDMIKTSHILEPGEIAGCSSNENFAARKVYEYAVGECLDPFNVMVTICDADSLFDPVYLEHVEAEFWRTPGGQRAIYDAPINTYRNLRECNLLVQATEISRCQDGLFSGLSFRPAQSNYSLTLGFAQEINFWDPSNTSEDFHTTLKAMAHTGQGEAVVVRIWSLILNDSVTGFQDRWTQAKRHMWGIEECAWTFEVFRHLRFIRWLNIFGMTVTRMLFAPNVIPRWLVLLCPSLRTILYTLNIQTLRIVIYWVAFFKLGSWIQVIIREIFLRRYILADRKHMGSAGCLNWLMIFTFFPLVEFVANFIFFSCATWVQLWRAFRGNKSIVYVVAPKAFADQVASIETKSNPKKST
jgi:cellulose synthase/poly-beta-1,6-N-acetylglucosamine synthase-like glycosyltransferase